MAVTMHVKKYASPKQSEEVGPGASAVASQAQPVRAYVNRCAVACANSRNHQQLLKDELEERTRRMMTLVSSSTTTAVRENKLVVQPQGVCKEHFSQKNPF